MVCADAAISRGAYSRPMQSRGGSAGARERAAEEVLPQSRREIVRRGLARSDLDWAKAVTGLREALLGCPVSSTPWSSGWPISSWSDGTAGTRRAEMGLVPWARLVEGALEVALLTRPHV